MGTQALKQMGLDESFLSPVPKPLPFLAGVRRLARFVGGIYQLVIWVALVIGIVHTVQSRFFPHERGATQARQGVSLGIDYLSSLRVW